MAVCYRSCCDISVILLKIKVNSFNVGCFLGFFCASCLFCIPLSPLNYPEGHFHIYMGCKMLLAYQMCGFVGGEGPYEY